MDEFIQVKEANCLEIGRKIVARLKGKTFTIVSFDPAKLNLFVDPSIITRSLAGTVPGNFTIHEGRFRIPLSESRAISWDLEFEEVWVTFLDNAIVIKRILTGKQLIFRVIVF